MANMDETVRAKFVETKKEEMVGSLTKEDDQKSYLFRLS